MRSRMLIFIFLLAQIVLSVCVIAKHNVYDDEYASLSYVEKPVGEIIRVANGEDVHPPGMYILAHLAYRAIPSARWMTLLTLLLWDAGLIVYLWAVTPLLPSTISQLMFLLFATLHPQLMMWGLTTRWYGYWTGPALAIVVLALCLDRKDPRPQLSYRRAGILGIGLAILFYVNYITIVFALALSIAILFRYGIRAWRPLLLTLLVTGALVAPQLRPMVKVHMANGGGQRAGAIVSFARMLEGILPSEAFLPWHPLAILSLLAGLVMTICALRWLAKTLPDRTKRHRWLVAENGLATLCVLAVVLYFAECILGFGIKPRNGLILIPLLAAPLALAVESLQRRWLQASALLVWVLWSGGGIANLLERRGLAKASMLNHPEEVLQLIVAGSAKGQCSVLVTYDQMLSYAAAVSHANNLLLMSPWPNATPVLLPSVQAAMCEQFKVYAVETTTGGLGVSGQRMKQEVTDLRKEIAAPPKLHNLNYDPDAKVKRRISLLGPEVKGLPDYRYIVNEFDLPASGLPALAQELGDFKPINPLK